jgi:biopolymer transport protein ExbB/TolQ
MYIYSYIITGSLGLKIIFFATTIISIVTLAVAFRRISVFNTINQVILEIEGSITSYEKSFADIYLKEVDRNKLLANPISATFIAAYEEFIASTSYNIIETKLLRIKNTLYGAESNSLEFINKFQRIIFNICAFSPIFGLFFILFSFSDLFLSIGLNGDKDYTFLATKIGEILMIGVLTIFNAIFAFAVYIFLNHKSLQIIKKINNFSLFIFNKLSSNLENEKPISIKTRYTNSSVSSYKKEKNVANSQAFEPEDDDGSQDDETENQNSDLNDEDDQDSNLDEDSEEESGEDSEEDSDKSEDENVATTSGKKSSFSSDDEDDVV